MRNCLLAVAFLAAALQPGAAFATLGIFEHGYGIRSQSMGGVAIGIRPVEATMLGANPAHALKLGHRFDIGVNMLEPKGEGSIVGNAAGADAIYRNTLKRYYPIPQGGYVRPLSDRWAAGFSLLSAGLGPAYEFSPYERFGGAQRSEITLGQMTLTMPVAFQLTPNHAIGASLNLSYQTFRARGLDAFAAPEGTENNVSVAPEHVTDNGKDHSFGGGFSLGWYGEFGTRWSAGASYRSKSWTQKHRRYRGLIPGGGRLELPAMYGAGFAFAATDTLTLAAEFFRIMNASEDAFGNRLIQLEEGNRLGSSDGPGFGVRNQSSYKFGISWQATRSLTLTAGHIRARQMTPPTETLFGFLAPVMITTHYTFGAAYAWGEWEVFSYLSYAPRQTVLGQNSIPEALGGGEANMSLRGDQIGFSVGRRFGD